MEPKVNPRRLAIAILERIFCSQSYSDILLDTSFKKFKLSQKDRALTTELVYGTLRWLGKLDWIIQKMYSGKWNGVPEIIKRDLEVGLYQLLFLDRIPDYAAVNEAVKIAVKEKGKIWGSAVNSVLRRAIREIDSIVLPSIDDDPVLAISVSWSHPQWLVQKWINQFGVERTFSICEANNVRPDISIRINRLKADTNIVLNDLHEMGINAKQSALLDEFLTIEKGGELVSLESFKKGFFTIQDVSAGLIGHLIDPRPGECILDMAAAPGGKATHIAELGNDQSKIIAVDLHPARIHKVMENKNRLGLKNLLPVLADARRLGLRLVDKVLLDVPCSGFGVIRRKGELRWRRSPKEIEKIVVLQKELLKAGADKLKRNGILVYSTCSILPEENEDIIHDFLENNKSFIVEDASRFVDSNLVSDQGFIETWPDIHGIDGSFAVRLKRGE